MKLSNLQINALVSLAMKKVSKPKTRDQIIEEHPEWKDTVDETIYALSKIPVELREELGCDFDEYGIYTALIDLLPPEPPPAVNKHELRDRILVASIESNDLTALKHSIPELSEI
jgi:hypothetical protein